MPTKIVLCIVALMFLYTRPSSADTIRCYYTEPFITTSYDSDSSVFIIDEGGNHKTIIYHVSFHIVASNSFDLRDQENVLVQRMVLNYKGGDGMSDTVFPYDAIYYSSSVPDGLHGGCASTHHAARDNN